MYIFSSLLQIKLKHMSTQIFRLKCAQEIVQRLFLFSFAISYVSEVSSINPIKLKGVVHS